MGDRLKALRRVASVQAEMAKLAEWRLTVAERSLADITMDQERLRQFVDGSEALGASLARSALRASHALDQRLADFERERAVRKAKLDDLRRRSEVVGSMVKGAEREARRVEEAKNLGIHIDEWLARSLR